MTLTGGRYVRRDTHCTGHVLGNVILSNDERQANEGLMRDHSFYMEARLQRNASTRSRNGIVGHYLMFFMHVYTCTYESTLSRVHKNRRLE